MVDSLRDFDGFVFGVVRRLDAIDHGFRSVHGEVGVQFEHGASGRDGVIAIDLDLIVVLGGGGKAGQE
jgi:hypothetical protein